MPFLNAGGSTVYYDLTGPRDAPVVAFGNSLGTNLHVWDAVVAGFTRTFRVLRYDMRGHGLTDRSEAPTMDGLASDVANLLDALELERVRYVGLSIGGMVGQRLAAAHPERVEALVLCATANRIGTAEVWNERIEAVRRGGMAAVSDGVLERWFTPQTHFERPELIRGFTNMVERTLPESYIGLCLAIRDADLAAGARRQGDDSPDLLVGVTRIDAEVDGDLDALVELGRQALAIEIENKVRESLGVPLVPVAEAAAPSKKG